MAISSFAGELPVKEWTTTASTPLVIYITGDGGFNKFSTTFCNTLNASGYNIAGINAKSYFWDKKTPEQTATDIAAYLVKQFSNRKNQQLIVVGYSFGADVMPFIINRLPAVIQEKLVFVALLSSSTSTDFEIHWSDMFGGNQKRSMDVLAEINKMKVPELLTIFGSSEDTFPVNDITLENHHNETLAGGHHFDGNTEDVVKTLLKYIN